MFSTRKSGNSSHEDFAGSGQRITYPRFRDSFRPSSRLSLHRRKSQFGFDRHPYRLPIFLTHEGVFPLESIPIFTAFSVHISFCSNIQAAHKQPVGTQPDSAYANFLSVSGAGGKRELK